MRWQASSSGISAGGTVSTIPDITGNGNAGTVAGSPTVVSGYNGHLAYHTDGSASALLGSAAAAAFFNGPASNPNGWTVAIVFVPNNPGIGTNMFGVNASTTNYMLSRITVSATAYTLSSLCESGSNTYNSIPSATAAASLTIPNVAIGVGAASGSGVMQNVFLNGTKSVSTGSTAVLSGLNALHFGLSYANNAPNTSPSYWAGQYYDIIVWRNALTDPQVAQATTYLQSVYS